MMKTQGESVEKFKALLNVLFQFDAADLDFGIYRIMNYKRKEIESFIQKDLIEAVEKEFELFKAQSTEDIRAKIQKKRKEIEELEEKLGQKILRNGQIEDEFKDKPFAKEYLELKIQLDEVEVTEAAQAQVFNDLFSFFSRYYEDGDFISKRRSSTKGARYAIPYSGEEVKLHWANFDQYYVKTGEVFKDYEFDSKGWRIAFRTSFADVETGNLKGERRYFLLALSDSVNVDKESKTCLIQFEYRRLTEADLSKYRVKTKSGEEKKAGIQQDELNTVLNGMILQKIKVVELKAVLSEEQDEKTILEKHLYKYTRKITSDFFVHKNLKGFLERELDYFIKTEVLDISNLDPRHITRAKVVDNIGKRIIEFLSQIEEYQKVLWEKKRFVLRTDYVITTDQIPEQFQEEILGCKPQLQEWQDLGFGQISKKNDLSGNKLPVDTKHFPDTFKERLLEKLSEQGNLDDLIDGILIKSENWQALNLILEKYRRKISAIYIDPPYNTAQASFLYKNNYKHSSWLAMMIDRIVFCKTLLKDDGIFATAIDDEELFNLKGAIDDYGFGSNNFMGNLVIQSNPRGRTIASYFATSHDYCLFYASDPSRVAIQNIGLTNEQRKAFNLIDEISPYRLLPLRRSGGLSTPQERPNSYYPIYFDEQTGRVSIQPFEHAVAIYPIDVKGNKRVWRITPPSLQEAILRKDIVVKKAANGYVVYMKDRIKPGRKPKTIWIEPKYDASSHGTMQIEKLFGDSKIFSYPKSLNTVCDILEIICDNKQKGSIVLDFFAGSGTTAHAVMKLNEQDNARRKYIIVEMADYFDTVMIPRLKKICYTLNWKAGKPQDTNGVSQVIKYQYVEQYEDTLHNIEFPNEEKGQLWLKLFPEETSEYVMKYMLRYETEGSLSLLNVKQFDSPFEYKLKIISGSRGEEIVAVDLAETFNCLLGLKAGRYKFLSENERKYVIVLGERGNRRVAVAWRPTKDIDLQRDKEVIDQAIADFYPDEIFVNGDAYIKGYKTIESEFKSLMGV